MPAFLAWVTRTVFVVVGTTVAVAQTPQNTAPSVITGGSSSTSIGGQPAARSGDTTDGGSAVVQGSSNVFIDGRPAATVGDRTGCGGVTVGGAGNVFINGKPAARAGDLTTGCANK
jgi:uncharacterized Zn-binding protein involved in type VI secretion